MNELLEQVLKAHGGLDRYRTVERMSTEIIYEGPFWEFKGHADFAGTEEVVADLHTQKIRSHQPSTGRLVDFEQATGLVTVTNAEGEVVEELKNPRATFEGYTSDSKWSVGQMAYFRSYATHHYLPEPFLFAWPGAVTKEIAPWIENGETWRGLSVTFPSTVDTHNETQKYYFDSDGLLRRMDYQPVVNGYSPTAHYVLDHTTVDGFVVPTRRNIHIRQEDGTPDTSWIPISLELKNISIY